MTAPLKQFKLLPGISGGGICPECGKINRQNEGSSFATDEGTFFWCAYCNKPSVLIHNGARLNFNGTIYEIAEINDPVQNLIATIPVTCPDASPLWKPNTTEYQYFHRNHIAQLMNDGYREDL